MADRLLCANPAHSARQVVARLSFPDAQFATMAACWTCTSVQVGIAVDRRHAILVEPVEATFCPGGCGCRLGTGDADRRECGCDGGCCDA